MFKNFVNIRKCTAAQLIEATREHPRYFINARDAYESRPPEVFRACALAALEGAAADAGETFLQPRYNASHRDIILLTRYIFEMQSVFDPLQDPAFCAEAMQHCVYYVLQYTNPAAVHQDTDFLPDQFAACFATDGILYLRKRGCDFWKDSPEKEQSDLENYRLFVQYCNKEGHYICGDLSLGSAPCGEKEKPRSCGFLSLHLQKDENGMSYAYYPEGYRYGNVAYTQEEVLRLVNADSVVHYSRIEFVA